MYFFTTDMAIVTIPLQNQQMGIYTNRFETNGIAI